MNDTAPPPLTLAAADPAEREAFARRMVASFALAVTPAGITSEVPTPTVADATESFDDPRSEVLDIRAGARTVGGAVISGDDERRSLELFFIDAAEHGAGHGRAAWRAIEQRYATTRVWETHTPHFEVRNIHFYVNVCGFDIVEFFHPGHPLEHPEGAPAPDAAADHDVPELMFRFEKVMTPSTELR